MEQYRFDPYTGQPLNQSRTVNNRTWLGNGQSGPAYPPQYQQGQGGQLNQPGLIVRPVASFDEAKAIPTDFSGALTIMPDWAHGYIYAKALGDNGTPVFRTYRDIDCSSVQTPPPQTVADSAFSENYATKDDLDEIWKELHHLRDDFATEKTPVKETAEKPAAKGNKS